MTTFGDVRSAIQNGSRCPSLGRVPEEDRAACIAYVERAGERAVVESSVFIGQVRMPSPYVGSDEEDIDVPCTDISRIGECHSWRVHRLGLESVASSEEMDTRLMMNRWVCDKLLDRLDGWKAVIEGEPELSGLRERLFVLPERLVKLLVSDMDWLDLEYRIRGQLLGHAQLLRRVASGSAGALFWDTLELMDAMMESAMHGDPVSLDFEMVHLFAKTEEAIEDLKLDLMRFILWSAERSDFVLRPA
jgi:hypothetical protein